MIASSKYLEPIAGFDPKRLQDGFFFDKKKADRAVSFFEDCLCHVKNSRYTRANQPFILDPWQKSIVSTLFGSVDKDGNRRYRTCYIEIPRKNGKSTLAAGLALYGLFADGEDGAECYFAAADKEQAQLAYDIAAGMVRKCEILSTNSKIKDSVKRIIYKDSYLRAISSDAHTKHGFNTHFAVLDELHAWKGRELWDVLATSTGARCQPLIVGITTAGHDRQSICWEVHDYAEKVRDGKVDDPSFLPIIFGADLKDDYRDPATWEKANPNLGVSLAREYMEGEAKKADANPSYLNTFLQLHLNVWTQQRTRWLMTRHWDSCSSEPVEFCRDRAVFGAIDLSSTTDLTAWAMVQKAGIGYKVKVRFFIPESRADEAEKRDGVPYRRWAEQGWIVLTRGARVDYETVKATILADCEANNICRVGYDPWNAEAMQQQLDYAGIETIQVRQGFASFSEPSKLLEACVVEGSLQHEGNPVLAWCAENIEVETNPYGDIRPVKPEHNAWGKRIDGLIAVAMGIAVDIESKEETFVVSEGMFGV